MNEEPTMKVPMKAVLVFADNVKTVTLAGFCEMIMQVIRPEIAEIARCEIQKLPRTEKTPEAELAESVARLLSGFVSRKNRAPAVILADSKRATAHDRPTGDINAPLPGSADPALSILEDGDIYRRRLVWVYDAIRPGEEYTRTGEEFMKFLQARGFSLRATTRASAMTQVCHILNDLINVGLLERRFRGGRYIRRVAGFSRDDAIMLIAESTIVLDSNGRRRLVPSTKNAPTADSVAE